MKHSLVSKVKNEAKRLKQWLHDKLLTTVMTFIRSDFIDGSEALSQFYSPWAFLTIVKPGLAIRPGIQRKKTTGSGCDFFGDFGMPLNLALRLILL